MPSAAITWILLGCYLLSSWNGMSLGQGVGYEKPLIQVLPSNVITKGGNFTIRCRGPLTAVKLILYRGNALLLTLPPTGNEAEFHFSNVQQRDVGTYTCRYAPTSDLGVYSDSSDPIYIYVRDTFPRPSLQASPGTVAMRGGTLTFRCTGEHPNMRFTLRMGGTDRQTEEPRGNEAVFTIGDVQRKDEGSYDCYYQTKSAQSAYSDTSGAILIRVRDLPKASISLEPVPEVKGDYRIRCSAPEDQNVPRFFLYQDGVEAPLTDRSAPPGTHHVTFPVSSENAKIRQRYRCAYQITEFGNYLLSPLSELVSMATGKEPDEDDAKTVDVCREPDFSQRIIIQSVMVAVVLLVLLVILVEHFYSIKKKTA